MKLTLNKSGSNIKNGKTIKSLYVLKEILSFMNSKLKLDIIIYNKQLQKEFGIDIKDYKEISRRIFKGDRNGKGAEYYDNGNIKYEGEYLKGKKNGRGKEFNYDNSKLKFEGEYLNGEKNGMGKEYYYNGNIKFKGQYLKGKKWNGKEFNYYNSNILYEIKNGKGNIKEYDFYGELIFDGNYLNGIKWTGIGKEYNYVCAELEFKKNKFKDLYNYF